MLCLSNGCRPVSRQELASVPTPEPTGRHRPVAHADLADTLLRAAESRSLSLRKESWGITNDGQRLYGAVDFNMPRSFRLPHGIGPSLGIRHANDKTMSIQLTAGARVLVCDNGCLIGELETTRRKHTSGLDLDALIGNALDEYLLRLPDFNQVYVNLVSRKLTDMRAKALIHDAFMRNQVMAVKYIPHVSSRYFESQEHQAQFPARNRWGLYNAFTETFKAEPVTLQTESFRALSRALVPTRN